MVTRPLQNQAPVVLPRQRHRHSLRCLIVLHALKTYSIRLKADWVDDQCTLGSPSCLTCRQPPNLTFPSCLLSLVLSRPRTCVCRRNCRCGLTSIAPRSSPQSIHAMHYSSGSRQYLYGRCNALHQYPPPSRRSGRRTFLNCRSC